MMIKWTDDHDADEIADYEETIDDEDESHADEDNMHEDEDEDEAYYN